MRSIVEAKSVKYLAGLRLEAVATEVLVLFLHLAERRQDSIHVVGFRRIGHLVLERFELVMQDAEAAAAGDRFVEDRSTRHLLDVLPEVADGDLLRHRHVTLVRRLFPDDHPEERGLAGAVRADEPDLFTGVELERGIDKQDLAAVLLAHAGERNHTSNSPRPTRTASPPTRTRLISRRSPSIEM